MPDIIMPGGGSGSGYSPGGTDVAVADGGTGASDAATARTNLGLISGVYGDGSDSSVTFDGSSVILGITPSANIYTLARDIFCSAITINSGVFIKTNGFRIYCTGTITNNGTIYWNGGDGAAGGTAGAQCANGSASLNLNGSGGSAPSTAGGAGGTAGGSAGTNAGSNVRTFGAAGGAGGDGSGGTGAAAGTVQAPAAKAPPPRSLTPFPGYLVEAGTTAATIVAIGGGTGGGGGGGDGTSGGGGGGGGGLVVVLGRLFAGTGAIQARGGNGGTPAAGNRGGGGGGGGGVVIVVSSSVSAGAISGQTIDATGGTKGTKTGTGTDGVNGSNGNVYLIQHG